MESDPTVLVVEDNDDQLELLKTALEYFGYDVVVSKSSEAVENLSDSNFDCLVIDEFLSDGRRGSALVSLARARDPALGVVLTSTLELGDIPIEAECLLKPYHVADLVSAVRRCSSAPKTT